MRHSLQVFWQLGRNVKLFVGNDGESRFARLKTKHGFVGRPLFKLRFLECATPEETNSKLSSDVPASVDDVSLQNSSRTRRATAANMLRRLQQWRADNSI